MTELWSILLPLAVVTAVLPVQLAVTILLLRSPGGRAKAAAWIGGMTLIRLAQFAVFGVVLDRAVTDDPAAPSLVEGALLLMVSVLLFVSAARKLASSPDEDAPPPRWMTMLDGATTGRASLMGAGLVALSPKLWAFTLSAIGAIEDAGLAPGPATATFIAWVVLAESTHLLALLAVVIAPERGAAAMAGVGAWLERAARPLMVGISLVFGFWFLAKALGAFGFALGS